MDHAKPFDRHTSTNEETKRRTSEIKEETGHKTHKKKTKKNNSAINSNFGMGMIKIDKVGDFSEVLKTISLKGNDTKKFHLLNLARKILRGGRSKSKTLRLISPLKLKERKALGKLLNHVGMFLTHLAKIARRKGLHDISQLKFQEPLTNDGKFLMNVLNDVINKYVHHSSSSSPPYSPTLSILARMGTKAFFGSNLTSNVKHYFKNNGDQKISMKQYEDNIHEEGYDHKYANDINLATKENTPKIPMYHIAYIAPTVKLTNRYVTSSVINHHTTSRHDIDDEVHEINIPEVTESMGSNMMKKPLTSHEDAYKHHIKLAKQPHHSYQMIPLCQRGQLLRSTTIKGGLGAGKIIFYRRVNNPATCRKHCCATSKCNIAMVVKNMCYIMRCTDKKDCIPVYMPQRSDMYLTYLYRGIYNNKVDLNSPQGNTLEAKYASNHSLGGTQTNLALQNAERIYINMLKNNHIYGDNIKYIQINQSQDTTLFRNHGKSPSVQDHDNILKQAAKNYPNEINSVNVRQNVNSDTNIPNTFSPTKTKSLKQKNRIPTEVNSIETSSHQKSITDETSLTSPVPIPETFSPYYPPKTPLNLLPSPKGNTNLPSTDTDVFPTSYQYGDHEESTVSTNTPSNENTPISTHSKKRIHTKNHDQGIHYKPDILNINVESPYEDEDLLDNRENLRSMNTHDKITTSQSPALQTTMKHIFYPTINHVTSEKDKSSERYNNTKYYHSKINSKNKIYKGDGATLEEGKSPRYKISGDELKSLEEMVRKEIIQLYNITKSYLKNGKSLPDEVINKWRKILNYISLLMHKLYANNSLENIIQKCLQFFDWMQNSDFGHQDKTLPKIKPTSIHTNFIEKGDAGNDDNGIKEIEEGNDRVNMTQSSTYQSNTSPRQKPTKEIDDINFDHSEMLVNGFPRHYKPTNGFPRHYKPTNGFSRHYNLTNGRYENEDIKLETLKDLFNELSDSMSNISKPILNNEKNKDNSNNNNSDGNISNGNNSNNNNSNEGSFDVDKYVEELEDEDGSDNLNQTIGGNSGNVDQSGNPTGPYKTLTPANDYIQYQSVRPTDVRKFYTSEIQDYMDNTGEETRDVNENLSSINNIIKQLDKSESKDITIYDKSKNSDVLHENHLSEIGDNNKHAGKRSKNLTGIYEPDFHVNNDNIQHEVDKMKKIELDKINMLEINNQLPRHNKEMPRVKSKIKDFMQNPRETYKINRSDNQPSSTGNTSTDEEEKLKNATEFKRIYKPDSSLVKSEEPTTSHHSQHPITKTPKSFDEMYDNLGLEGLLNRTSKFNKPEIEDFIQSQEKIAQNPTESFNFHVPTVNNLMDQGKDLKRHYDFEENGEIMNFKQTLKPSTVSNEVNNTGISDTNSKDKTSKELTEVDKTDKSEIDDYIDGQANMNKDLRLRSHPTNSHFRDNIAKLSGSAIRQSPIKKISNHLEKSMKKLFKFFSDDNDGEDSGKIHTRESLDGKGHHMNAWKEEVYEAQHLKGKLPERENLKKEVARTQKLKEVGDKVDINKNISPVKELKEELSEKFDSSKDLPAIPHLEWKEKHVSNEESLENQDLKEEVDNKQDLVKNIPAVEELKEELSNKLDLREDLPETQDLPEPQNLKGTLTEKPVMEEEVPETHDLQKEVASKQDLYKSIVAAQEWKDELSKNQDLKGGISGREDLKEEVSKKKDLQKEVAAKQDLYKNIAAVKELKEELSKKLDLKGRIFGRKDLREEVSRKKDLQREVADKQDLYKNKPAVKELNEELSKNQHGKGQITERDDLKKEVSTKKDLQKEVVDKQELYQDVAAVKELKEELSKKLDLIQDLPETQDLKEEITRKLGLNGKLPEKENSKGNLIENSDLKEIIPEKVNSEGAETSEKQELNEDTDKKQDLYQNLPVVQELKDSVEEEIPEKQDIKGKGTEKQDVKEDIVKNQDLKEEIAEKQDLIKIIPVVQELKDSVEEEIPEKQDIKGKGIEKQNVKEDIVKNQDLKEEIAEKQDLIKIIPVVQELKDSVEEEIPEKQDIKRKGTEKQNVKEDIVKNPDLKEEIAEKQDLIKIIPVVQELKDSVEEEIPEKQDIKRKGTEKQNVKEDIVKNQDLKEEIAEKQDLIKIIPVVQELKDSVEEEIPEKQDIKRKGTEKQNVKEDIVKNQDLKEEIAEKQDLIKIIPVVQELKDSVEEEIPEKQDIKRKGTEKQNVKEDIAKNQDLKEEIAEKQDLIKIIPVVQELKDSVEEEIPEKQDIKRKGTEKQNVKEDIVKSQDLKEKIADEKQDLIKNIPVVQELKELIGDIRKKEDLKGNVAGKYILEGKVTEKQTLKKDMTNRQSFRIGKGNMRTVMKTFQSNHNTSLKNKTGIGTYKYKADIQNEDDLDTMPNDLYTVQLKSGIKENLSDAIHHLLGIRTDFSKYGIELPKNLSSRWNTTVNFFNIMMQRDDFKNKPEESFTNSLKLTEEKLARDLHDEITDLDKFIKAEKLKKNKTEISQPYLIKPPPLVDVEANIKNNKIDSSMVGNIYPKEPIILMEDGDTGELQTSMRQDNKWMSMRNESPTIKNNISIKNNIFFYSSPTASHKHGPKYSENIRTSNKHFNRWKSMPTEELSRLITDLNVIVEKKRKFIKANNLPSIRSTYKNKEESRKTIGILNELLKMVKTVKNVYEHHEKEGQTKVQDIAAHVRNKYNEEKTHQVNNNEAENVDTIPTSIVNVEYTTNTINSKILEKGKPSPSSFVENNNYVTPTAYSIRNVKSYTTPSLRSHSSLIGTSRRKASTSALFSFFAPKSSTTSKITHTNDPRNKSKYISNLKVVQRPISTTRPYSVTEMSANNDKQIISTIRVLIQKSQPTLSAEHLPQFPEIIYNNTAKPLKDHEPIIKNNKQSVQNKINYDTSNNINEKKYGDGAIIPTSDLREYQQSFPSPNRNKLVSTTIRHLQTEPAKTLLSEEEITKSLLTNEDADIDNITNPNLNRWKSSPNEGSVTDNIQFSPTVAQTYTKGISVTPSVTPLIKTSLHKRKHSIRHKIKPFSPDEMDFSTHPDVVAKPITKIITYKSHATSIPLVGQKLLLYNKFNNNYHAQPKAEEKPVIRDHLPSEATLIQDVQQTSTHVTSVPNTGVIMENEILVDNNHQFPTATQTSKQHPLNLDKIPTTNPTVGLHEYTRTTLHFFSTKRQEKLQGEREMSPTVNLKVLHHSALTNMGSNLRKESFKMQRNPISKGVGNEVHPTSRFYAMTGYTSTKAVSNIPYIYIPQMINNPSTTINNKPTPKYYILSASTSKKPYRPSLSSGKQKVPLVLTKNEENLSDNKINLIIPKIIRNPTTTVKDRPTLNQYSLVEPLSGELHHTTEGRAQPSPSVQNQNKYIKNNFIIPKIITNPSRKLENKPTLINQYALDAYSSEKLQRTQLTPQLSRNISSSTDNRLPIIFLQREQSSLSTPKQNSKPSSNKRPFAGDTLLTSVKGKTAIYSQSSLDNEPTPIIIFMQPTTPTRKVTFTPQKPTQPSVYYKGLSGASKNEKDQIHETSSSLSTNTPLSINASSQSHGDIYQFTSKPSAKVTMLNDGNIDNNTNDEDDEDDDDDDDDDDDESGDKNENAIKQSSSNDEHVTSKHPTVLYVDHENHGNHMYENTSTLQQSETSRDNEDNNKNHEHRTTSTSNQSNKNSIHLEGPLENENHEDQKHSSGNVYRPNVKHAGRYSPEDEFSSKQSPKNILLYSLHKGSIYSINNSNNNNTEVNQNLQITPSDEDVSNSKNSSKDNTHQNNSLAGKRNSSVKHILPDSDTQLIGKISLHEKTNQSKLSPFLNGRVSDDAYIDKFYSTNIGKINVTDGGKINPTDGGKTNPTDGGKTNPTDGGNINPTDGGKINPTDGGNINPTDDGKINSTNGGKTVVVY